MWSEGPPGTGTMTFCRTGPHCVVAGTHEENHMRVAYLDGTSAGMIGSAIAAGFAGVAVFVKMRWHQITGVFRKGKTVEPAASEAGATGSED